MSVSLNTLSERFEWRLSVRRRMLEHLGIDIEDRTAGFDDKDVRATLMSCISCDNPEVCEGWLRRGDRGMPMFCRARDAFHHLAAAQTAAEKTALRKTA